MSTSYEPHSADAANAAPKKKKRKILILLILIPLCIISATAAFFISQHSNKGGDSDNKIHQENIVPPTKNVDVPPNGNISNMSFAIADGEYIYYSGFDNNGLIRARNDLSGAVTLTEERSSFIYLDDDSVYCLARDESDSQKEKIISISKEDSIIETIIEPKGKISCMYMDGEYIFYSLSDPGTGLYKYDIASKQVTTLSEENISMINAAEDLIYCKYTDRNTGKASIMSISKEGQDVKLSLIGEDKEAGLFEVYGEHIYYTDSNADLCRTPLDGGTSELLVSNGAISGFNITGDRIYLLTVTKSESESGTGKTIWRESVISCNLDGTGETSIAKDLMPGSPINIIGSKIYGFEAGTDTDADIPSENRQLFRMDKEGKTKEVI